MSNTKTVMAVLLAVAAVAFWWLGRPAPVANSVEPAQPASPAAVTKTAVVTATSTGTTVAASAEQHAVPDAPPVQAPPAAHVMVEDAPANVEKTASVAVTPRPPEQEAIQALRLVVRNYGQKFLGNPVGNNAEITAELNGGNKRGIHYLEGMDARINGKGELIDEWETPYFFHQLSRNEMEIHSAGPDRKMGTSDDIVVK